MGTAGWGGRNGRNGSRRTERNAPPTRRKRPVAASTRPRGGRADRACHQRTKIATWTKMTGARPVSQANPPGMPNSRTVCTAIPRPEHATADPSQRMEARSADVTLDAWPHDGGVRLEPTASIPIELLEGGAAEPLCGFHR